MAILVSAVALQVVLPIALLVWLWRGRSASVFALAIDVTLAAATLAALSLALPWTVVPRVVRDGYVIALVAAAIRRARRRRQSDVVTRRVLRLVFLACRGAAAVLMLGLVALAMRGMRLPAGDRIDLVCPFPSGTFAAVNGGNSLLLNNHLGTLAPDPRFAPWRGQSHGVDIVRVDAWGRRASGLMPATPARYFIYGQPVIAPCAGTAVSVANDRPDMPVPTPDPDRTRLAGNHVMLDCDGIEVLLAHLQPGSVLVAVGDAIAVGTPLGRVGNSGNTTEPHLHVSAQRRGPGDALLGGEPIRVTIGDDFLVRNERLRCG